MAPRLSLGPAERPRHRPATRRAAREESREAHAAANPGHDHSYDTAPEGNVPPSEDEARDPDSGGSLPPPLKAKAAKSKKKPPLLAALDTFGACPTVAALNKCLLVKVCEEMKRRGIKVAVPKDVKGDAKVALLRARLRELWGVTAETPATNGTEPFEDGLGKSIEAHVVKSRVLKIVEA
ncbi:hypothetical protein M885DRAFT_560534, partial [Pelagophyceae sp. CCMP2097]